MTTLYGRGAITLTDDRHEYRSRNGRIELPEHMVNRALSMGFLRHPVPGMVVPETPEGEAVIDTESAPVEATGAREKTPIDASLSDDDLMIQFYMEALAASYSDEAASAIAADRVRHLRAGGDGYNRLAEGQTLADLVRAPATQSIDLPAGHPQVAKSVEAAARAHEDPNATVVTGEPSPSTTADVDPGMSGSSSTSNAPEVGADEVADDVAAASS